ncbi:MAG: Do family serine endopeptidase [Myxococcales bacterium]|nr:Do family serine endopeptidase [Myxococcales bacterium]
MTRFSVANVAERITPTVVNITTRRSHPPSTGFPASPAPHGEQSPQMGAGSGVIISRRGEIVTNNHVVEGAEEIRVTLSDRREFTAQVVGTDAASDLAFIKISAQKLPHMPFGDSSALRLGEFVLAIGNPFGFGQTVTLGIVSAKGRADIGIVAYEDFIQTDAAINPGNSGGPLVNLDGELVGINTAILSRSGGAQGIGFAVPSNMVRPIWRQIVQFGKVRRGWLGVSIKDLTPELAQSLSIGYVQGVLIDNVLAGGPAAQAQLKVQDVVIAIANNPVATSAQLRNRVALIEPGSTTNVSIIRNGRPKRVRIVLGEKQEYSVLSQVRPRASVVEGLSVRALSAERRRAKMIPRKVRGVLVSRVTPNSPAARAGVHVDDVITFVNKRRVMSLQDYHRAVPRQAAKLVLRLYSDGKARKVILRLPNSRH